MKFVKETVFLLVALLGPTTGAPQILEHQQLTYKVAKDKPLRVRLDIDAGEIKLHPAEKPLTVKLDFRYTPEKFDLDVDFDEARNRLFVYFDLKKWLKESNRTEGKVDIALPTGVPLELRSRIKAGAIEYQMGGLRLRDLYFKVLAGEVSLDFDRPNPEVMEDMEIAVKVGEITLRRLGNAHFREATINGAIGELRVDFTGEIPPQEFSSYVDIDLDLGETVLILPGDWPVRLKISKWPLLSAVDIPEELYKKGSYYYSQSYDQFDNKLFIKVSTGVGTLEIQTR